MTNAEIERLEMLIEEAAEVIKETCKILRFGYDSYHPADPSTNNRELLENEITDLLAIIYMMSFGDIDLNKIEKNVIPRALKKEKFIRERF